MASAVARLVPVPERQVRAAAEVLGAALEAAKGGEYQIVMIIGLTPSGDILHSYSGCSNLLELLGCVELIKSKILARTNR